MDKMNANDHPFKVVTVSGDGFYANSHPYQVVIVGGGGGTGGEARVVDKLPDVGEVGYIYLVLKEHTSQGDIYDEYVWALQQDGKTYDWEHLGTTGEVHIKLYNTTGQNTDGAMTQKAVTDELNKKQPKLTAGDNIKIENDVISTDANTRSVELTQAEYDALSQEEKMNGTIYFITDAEGGGGGKTYTGGNGITVDNVNNTISVNGYYIEDQITGKIEWYDGNGTLSGYQFTSAVDMNQMEIGFQEDVLYVGDGSSGYSYYLRQTETINDEDWSALWQ